MRYTKYALLGLMVVTMAVVAPAAHAAWTLDQAVLNTAAQAWQLSGNDAKQFSQMVQNMSALVAVNRGYTIPNKEEVGRMVGQLVARDVQADPDQLLYAVVDHALRTSRGCLEPASLSVPAPAEAKRAEWSQPDVATSTVAQAWQMSGENRAEFSKMVNSMLSLVMENRALSFADTKEAGSSFGYALRSELEQHPSDLLYTAVERAAIRTAALQPAP